ncbi:glycosyltransferase [Microbacterium sp. cf332]|uniref:glycosyltransferase n=1 Tax=Microbacterium sp. cf332 TaxID=1761804 RepID=UPI0008804FFD|nr:glycosyltransferase [Microbacterium sp. cf332]SDQ95172.1 UDP-N-acetylglucosamine:LPS N-acetylglucosamine transferase [Microbacterium sp. cf332]
MSVPGAPPAKAFDASQPRETPVADSLRGRRLLLVASTGGHLAQLDKIAQLLAFDPSSTWVTFEKPQSTSMLENRDHRFIPYIAPRDFKSVAQHWPWFRRLIREVRPEAVVSTGAAIALASHLPALAARVPSYYIESVSRFDGPSLTGRIMSRLPVRRLTQHDEWSSRRWPYEISVMDAYGAEPNEPSGPLKKVFVTLGTIFPYRFDALVDAVVAAVPHDVEIVWQLGATERTDLPGRVETEIRASEFERLSSEADLVITHAGVGTIMQLLDLGAPTLAVPRRQARNEHVDDHQEQICGELLRRGLATVSEAPNIDLSVMERARQLTPNRAPLGSPS